MAAGAGLVLGAFSSLGCSLVCALSGGQHNDKGLQRRGLHLAPITTIDFGTMPQGTDTAPKTIHVRNEGTVPVRIIMNGAAGLRQG